MLGGTERAGDAPESCYFTVRPVGDNRVFVFVIHAVDEPNALNAANADRIANDESVR
jgi:hypothetical protein